MDFNKFKENFAEALEIEETDNLAEAVEFRQLSEWGSLAMLSLISMLDDEYDIQIETPELKKLITLGDLFNYVQAHK